MYRVVWADSRGAGPDGRRTLDASVATAEEAVAIATDAVRDLYWAGRVTVMRLVQIGGRTDWDCDLLDGRRRGIAPTGRESWAGALGMLIGGD